MNTLNVDESVNNNLNYFVGVRAKQRALLVLEQPRLYFRWPTTFSAWMSGARTI